MHLSVLLIVLLFTVRVLHLNYHLLTCRLQISLLLLQFVNLRVQVGAAARRTLHRRGRERGGLPTLSLVGYTNAGTSTLLNRLTDAGILAEDILFATVDTTTRRVKLPGYRTHPEVLLTDTVGFIQKLPTQLVAAFRATLEEVKEADVLVHIM